MSLFPSLLSGPLVYFVPGALCTPVSLLTSLTSLSPVSSISTVHVLSYSPQLSLCLSLPLFPSHSLDKDKFVPSVLLDEVSDTGSSGNHLAPLTLSHPSMSYTHKHPRAALAYNNFRERFKEHSVSACLRVSVISPRLHGCVLCMCTCQQSVCISAFLHICVHPPPAVRISTVGG